VLQCDASVFRGGSHIRHAGDSCRITVVASSRRVDLTVPAGASVIQLLPQLVQLTGEAERGAAGWLLTRVTGQPLDVEHSMEEAGVLDGEMLYLRPADPPVAPPAVEDFAEAVAVAVDAAGGRWTGRHGRRLLEALAAVLWIGAAATVPPTGGAAAQVPAATALATAAGLTALGAVLRWWPRRRPAAAVALVAALPFWTLGGAHVAAVAGETAALGLAAGAGAGGLVGIGAGALVAPELRRPAAVLALATAPLVAAAAVVQYLQATPVQAAAGLAVMAVAAIGLMPRVAAGAAGLTRPLGARMAIAGVRLGVGGARHLLAGLLAAAAVDLVAALAVLGLSQDVAARLLCAGGVLVVALRARHHRFIAEVLPLVAAASAGAVLLEAGLVAGAGAAVQLGVLLATGAVLLGAGRLPLERASSPHARQWLNRLETASNLALVPIAVAAAGGFAAVADLGRRIASA
jgi:type VII secretion integral membrane protein EccD